MTLDYCNSLLYGINDGLLKKLQAAQNAAARVTTKTRKFDQSCANFTGFRFASASSTSWR